MRRRLVREPTNLLPYAGESGADQGAMKIFAMLFFDSVFVGDIRLHFPGILKGDNRSARGRM